MNHKKALLEAILDSEAGISSWAPPRPPSRARHKKSHKGDKTGPDLHVGMPVVVRISSERKRGRRWHRDKNTVLGYLGCILVDWNEQDRGWWSWGNDLILYVVGASHSGKDAKDNLLRDQYLGRLIARSSGGYSWRNEKVVVGGKFATYHIEIELQDPGIGSPFGLVCQDCGEVEGVHPVRMVEPVRIRAKVCQEFKSPEGD